VGGGGVWGGGRAVMCWGVFGRGDVLGGWG